MSKKYNVAVVGATGLVGETMISILEERNFPVDKLHLLASSRSAGKTLKFGKQKITVQDLSTFDFKGVDIGLFSAGGSVSAEHAPRAAKAGCVVIDNTSWFRQEEDIPLVVPEVNPEAIAGYKNRGIIANPNCSTIQMLVALKPLRDAFGIHRIIVSTYQAVSGAGRRHMEDLAKQTALLMNGRPADSKSPWPSGCTMIRMSSISIGVWSSCSAPYSATKRIASPTTPAVVEPRPWPWPHLRWTIFPSIQCPAIRNRRWTWASAGT